MSFGKKENKERPARRDAIGALNATTAIKFTRQNERTHAP